MAKVQVQVAGGAIKQMEANSIRQLKGQLSGVSAYQATVNGEPASDSHSLSDFEFVTLTEKTKGA